MHLEWRGRYDYDEQAIRGSDMNKSGIYIISAGPRIANKLPIYVGKAENLKTRLLEHLSDGGVDTCIKKYVRENQSSFYYCYVSNERDRENIEHTLYKQWTPRCNERTPEGKEIKFNCPY